MQLRTDLACDLALAATGANQAQVALDALRQLDNETVCPFVAPANDLAVPILLTWNEAKKPGAAPTRALARLHKLDAQVTGAAAGLLALAVADLSVQAAIDAYERGDVRRARKLLDAIAKDGDRSPHLRHNRAVLALAASKDDDALAALHEVERDIPEALVNLGLAYDGKDEPARALQYYRAAVAAGVRYAPLAHMIRTKERLWGKGGEP
jgi:hypothetical protein